jgi:hypothetical protein
MTRQSMARAPVLMTVHTKKCSSSKCGHTCSRWLQFGGTARGLLSFATSWGCGQQKWAPRQGEVMQTMMDYTLACQKACCKVWSNLCPEESELHSFMAFAHTLYGMLGIVPINQSSGALRKTRNKLAMTLKPISGVRGCQWYLSFVTKWWTSGDLSTESLLIEQSCGPSSGATLLIYLWNRISTIYCEEVCQHTTTTQRVGIMETKYTLTRTANPWQQILCTNWHRC